MAKALVVYSSMFGNTEKVAKALAAGLEKGSVNVEVVKASDVKLDQLDKVDLLCVGSPVNAWGMSSSVKDFLGHLAVVKGLSGKKAFAFDTKLKGRLAGTAGGKIEKKLTKLGLTVVRHSESAVVKGREGPLEEGAEARFTQIGVELAKMI